MIQHPTSQTDTAQAGNRAQPVLPPPGGEPTLQQLAERRTRALADALEEAIRRAAGRAS
ncbi:MULTISPECIES: hypothetical protein [Cupriavidus]